MQSHMVDFVQHGSSFVFSIKTTKIAILTKAAVSVDSLERAFAPFLPLVVCSSREELKEAAATADFIVAQKRGCSACG